MRHFDILGCAVTVTCHEPALEAEVARLLASFSVPGHTEHTGRDNAPDQSSPTEHAVRVSGSSGGSFAIATASGTAHAPDQSTAVGHVLAYLNATALANAPAWTVHAGVVEWHGAAVAFPAASGEGKSTLTAACLGLGAGYVSDEALCLDPVTARVLPYPRPLALADPGLKLLDLDPARSRSSPASPHAETFLTAADLGSRDVTHRLPLGHLVVLRRRPGDPVVSAVPRSLVVEVLLRRSFNAWRDPATAFRLACQVAASAHVWRLSYADPVTGAQSLLDTAALTRH